MKEENVQFLRDNLKYMGFGEKLNGEMEKNIREQKTAFTIPMQTEFNKKKVEAELHFKKSDASDLYFFNKYDVVIRNANDTAKDLTQTFYVNKGQGVTLKESFNLLEGRAVHKNLINKEGEKYKAWVQLDLGEKDDKGIYKRHQYGEKHGYDLAAVVARYPIKELSDPKQKEELFNSLQKGNVQSVTIERAGKSDKFFVEADPKERGVKVYDAKMQLLSKEAQVQLQTIDPRATLNVQKEEQASDKKKELKETMSSSKENNSKQKKEDSSLLPKKRDNNKKGLGIS